MRARKSVSESLKPDAFESHTNNAQINLITVCG